MYNRSSVFLSLCYTEGTSSPFLSLPLAVFQMFLHRSFPLYFDVPLLTLSVTLYFLLSLSSNATIYLSANSLPLSLFFLSLILFQVVKKRERY